MTSYTGLPIHPMHVFVLLLAGAFYLSPRNHDGSTKYCHHSAKGQLNPEDLTCRHKLFHYFISQINIISICTYVQCTYIACMYVLCLLLLTNGFICFIFVECCTNVPAKLHSFSSVQFISIQFIPIEFECYTMSICWWYLQSAATTALKFIRRALAGGPHCHLWLATGCNVNHSRAVICDIPQLPPGSKYVHPIAMMDRQTSGRTDWLTTRIGDIAPLAESGHTDR